MKLYTGVGSRQTPADVLELMEKTAARLAKGGWTLRSGHAQGADRAFERGADGKAMIYLPWVGFGQSRHGDDPGEPINGHWFCNQTMWEQNYRAMQEIGVRNQADATQAVRRLHGRNYAQVLGHGKEIDPSRFVLCWCEEVKTMPQGGTASAVNLARFHNIHVCNLWRPSDRERVERWLK